MTFAFSAGFIILWMCFLSEICLLKYNIIYLSPSKEPDMVAEKLLSYNRANRAVAILCNHQRAPPKTFDQSMANLQAKVGGSHARIL